MEQRDDNVNVAYRLGEVARRDPAGTAIIEQRATRAGKLKYRKISFSELDEHSDRIAAGLRARGVQLGERLVLLVPPGIDFVTLVYGLLKSGAVMVLIDPGIGRQHLIDCLAEAKPQGFVAVPRGHVARLIFGRRFPETRHHVTVGRRWLWGGVTLAQLRAETVASELPEAAAHDAAAIIFTSGSTGAPKGVLYRHSNFARQVTEIRDRYGIQPGETDVACFPLFALFNAAMGVTTVFPDMDFTRPAEVNPTRLLSAIRDCNATQAFGSPALWNTVATYCHQHADALPSLRRILSAGAPVPPHVLQRMQVLLSAGGEMHTPYGATEALPVASISASKVLSDTQASSDDGAGTCVGNRFPGIEWQIVKIDDGPLATFGDVTTVPRGEIGELIVQGDVVTTEYVTKTEANALSKIQDGDRFWHRMGDVGYLDDEDRFWYCGRKSHRVELRKNTLFTIPCEAILNCHPAVYRSALVAVHAAGGRTPILVAELWPDQKPVSTADELALRKELLDLAKSHTRTQDIETVLLHPQLPVDIRHNSKIFREKVAVWAHQTLGRLASDRPD